MTSQYWTCFGRWLMACSDFIHWWGTEDERSQHVWYWHILASDFWRSQDEQAFQHILDMCSNVSILLFHPDSCCSIACHSCVTLWGEALLCGYHCIHCCPRQMRKGGLQSFLSQIKWLLPSWESCSRSSNTQRIKKELPTANCRL